MLSVASLFLRTPKPSVDLASERGSQHHKDLPASPLILLTALPRLVKLICYCGLRNIQALASVIPMFKNRISISCNLLLLAKRFIAIKVNISKKLLKEAY